MIIEPRVRGFICLTAHPDGAAQNVKNQIQYTCNKGKIDAPKRVLVIGASTGFGLASRIVSAFGSGAATIGVFLEKPSVKNKTASPGWYNSVAFHEQAQQAGLYAKSVNGDAFSDEVKEKTIHLIKEEMGQVDLIIYSLASPVRLHPETGITHRSVLKPIGDTFTDKTVDFHTGKVSTVSIEPALEEEIENTITVMGGDDWMRWIKALKNADVLAEGVTTLTYSYIGPKVTEPVYRKGTIGQAKDHLEKTANEICEELADLNGKAYVSVNKALVTQASSAIPVIPLYVSLLYQTMKEENVHEGCIEQINRLYRERLFSEKNVTTDEQGRIRIDDWEMREDIQQKITRLWEEATTENIDKISDLKGYKKDFMNLFGFEVENIDYSADTSEERDHPNIISV